MPAIFTLKIVRAVSGNASNPIFVTGDSVKVMLPRKDDDVAAKCYKALLRSMIEQNAAMILRYVYQVGKHLLSLNGW